MQEPFRVWEDVYIIASAEISHPYDCCVYLINGCDLVLVDSGGGLSFDRLVSNIEALRFDPEKLKAVLVTHAHIDHIGSLHRFQERYGVQVIAHKLDADAIEKGVSVAAEAYGIDYAPCHVDTRITGSEGHLQLGRHEVELVHIPGHTPGSMAAHVDMGNKRVLFGQDIHGPYYPEWGADRAQARVSLQKLVALKADILCEGHFGVYEPAAAVERYIQRYIDSL